MFFYFLISLGYEPAVVAHTFNLSTREAEVNDLSEFKASLVLKACCRTIRTDTETNYLEKTKTEQQQTNKGLGYLPFR